MIQWQEIESYISHTLNPSFKLETFTSIGGGSINRCFRLQSNLHSYFIKINSVAHLEMFRAEADGLYELSKHKIIRIPKVLACDKTTSHSFLLCEYLDLITLHQQAKLGEQLAQLHAISQQEFGWWRDNTIGSTVQINSLSDNWLDFWHQHRLGYQLNLAQQKGSNKKLQDLGEKLLSDAHLFFDNYKPKASLLHGDLWSGNAAETADGIPVIYDPAVYYGDREADIAMTELFGGFNQNFYAAYNQAWPLDAGYALRRDFYNLYHILNHCHLFGGHYQQQAVSIIEKLLSEIHS